MSLSTGSLTGKPSSLEHGLQQYFPDLLRFKSTPEMVASGLWPKIQSEVEAILDSVVVGAFSERSAVGLIQPNVHGGNIQLPTIASGSDIKALAWNIERGNQLDGIIAALKDHDGLREMDLLLLTELDHGMARSGNRNVAEEIAAALDLNYAFAPVYIALQKGSGVESEVAGENTNSIHGLAMFSKFAMRNIHAIPLPNGKDKMWGKEKRLGHLRALFADIEHPLGTFRAVTVHLDAHCSRAHRRLQMKIILDHLDTLPKLPTLIGGDWNTTGFNSQSSTRAIMGYWRRVFMGPKNVAKNHLPHPERFFEKAMFDDLERRGYEFRKFNELGVGTLHYDVGSIEKNTNLRDWVPAWCFPFIFWAAGRVGGKVSGRLDWFAGSGIEAASSPQTIGELTTEDGTPLSDHDAISLDLRFSKG